MTFAFAMVGCAADPPRPVDPAPDPTILTDPTWSTPPSFTPCAGCDVPTSAADFDLSPWIGWGAIQVAPDLGGDGVGDLVEAVRVQPAEYVYAGTCRLWPGLPAAVTPIVLGSTSSYSGYYGTSVGLWNPRATADATGDGGPDLWIERAAGDWLLVAGPILASAVDPPPVATLAAEPAIIEDVDGDGVADVVFEDDGEGVVRCSGPFVGEVDPRGCARAAAGWEASEIEAAGDLDGDGVAEVVVADWYDREVDAYLLDGDFADGLGVARGTIAARWGAIEGSSVADLDDDGYGDLLWVDHADPPDAPSGEIAVQHGPVAPGAALTTTDASLHLVGSGAWATPGEVLHAGTGTYLLLTVDNLAGVVLADASQPGTVDPLEASPVVGADGEARSASVGDVDGDGLDDLLVAGRGAGRGVWLYLGRSWP